MPSPIAVVAPAVVTADDGQFDVAVPSEGDEQLLIGNTTGPRVRVPYPDVSKLGPVFDLGDVALPPSADLLVRFRPGCEVRAVGPVGDLGLTMVEASYDAVSGLYRLRIPEPGLWWVEAICPDPPVATRLVQTLAQADRARTRQRPGIRGFRGDSTRDRLWRCSCL